jgi:hypothetical protein
MAKAAVHGVAHVSIGAEATHATSATKAAKRGRFKADNGEASLAAVVAGLGVAALPDLMIEPHVAAGVLTPVLRDHSPPKRECSSYGRPGIFPRARLRCLSRFFLNISRTNNDISPTWTAPSAIFYSKGHLIWEDSAEVYATNPFDWLGGGYHAV